MAIAALAVGMFGCKVDLVTSEPGMGELGLPLRIDFPRVGDAMQLHCGTLDCHGHPARNMRLYGHFGLRLNPTDNPLEPPSTTAEYEASYWSIVGLEPESLSKVVDGSATPTALALVRKARGTELHKGGQLMTKDDPLDRCVVGWLVRAFDPVACKTVIETPRPELDGGTFK